MVLPNASALSTGVNPLRVKPASCTLVACFAFAACAPALDWREISAEGTGLRVHLPCKPARHARPVVLAGERFEMNLLSCRAADATWALAWIAGADARKVSLLMDAWHTESVANVNGTTAEPLAFNLVGATPQAHTGRWRVQGLRPDGSAVVQDFSVFSHGTSIFQATVLTSSSQRSAADHYIDSLSFKP